MKTTALFLLLFIAFSLHSQYQVGHMSLNFKDASRSGGYAISGGIQMPGSGRDIGTEIYYPASAAGNNVAVATGTFPVIVLGHGFAMDWSSYDNIYNKLASTGYIVALPRTEGSLSPTHADFGADLRLLGSLLQSLNTSTVTGTTSFNGKLSSKTAIGGHSMGAGCSFLAAASNTTLTCLFNFAAATTNPSSISSASLTTVPTLMFSGQRDCVADTTVQNSHYAALVSGKKFHVIVKDVTHCDFGNGSNFNCTFGQGTSGCSNTISNTLAFGRYMNYLEPFLAFHLKDNCSEGLRFMDSIQTASPIRSGRKISGSLATPINVTISGGGAVCAGSSATLTASGATSYSWTGGINNGATFTPASSQTYTLTAFNAAGCSKTFTASVTVNPNPTVNAASSASVLCAGQTATLTASGASSYTWSSGPANATFAISPTSTSQYSVTGMDANGCSSVAVLTQSVTSCTTGFQAHTAPIFAIYPNPTKGEANITTDSANLEYSVEIVDISGKVVKKTWYDPKSTERNTISLAGFDSGLYILKISTNSDVQTFRLMLY